MEWSAEDIADLNPAQPGQIKSKLERYLSTAQINLSLSAKAASEIELREQDYVAAFFQLPFPVHVEPVWHSVATGTPGLRAELKFDLCQIRLTASNEFELLPHRDGLEGDWPLVTQVTALFQVWGIRARFHRKYLTHIESSRTHNPIIVPQVYSWIDNRPISLRDYGFNLSARLLREVVPLLRCVLPAYSICALREAPVPSRALGYHAMIAPGRLTFAGEAISTVSALLREHPTTQISKEVSATQISAAMKTQYREFGQFEAQLFALERLRAQGETALALIGSLSLLEWVLNAHFARLGKSKKLKLFDAIHHPEMDVLSDEEVELIDRARQARNRVVHETPPMRHSLTASTGTPGRELEGLSSPMPTHEVRQVIEVAFKAFREANRASSKTSGVEKPV
jgi:hypothetical protein